MKLGRGTWSNLSGTVQQASFVAGSSLYFHSSIVSFSANKIQHFHYSGTCLFLFAEPFLWLEQVFLQPHSEPELREGRSNTARKKK